MDKVVTFDPIFLNRINLSATLREWFNRNQQIIEELDMIYPNCLKYADSEDINIRTFARMAFLLQHYLVRNNTDNIDDQIYLTISYMEQEFNSNQDKLDEQAKELLFISKESITFILKKISTP